MFHAKRFPISIICATSWWIVVALTGCGTTREHQATEQLVVSEAVDRNIQDLDFRPLSGRKVYLDTSYMRNVKGPTFVNAEYVISGLRQQILAAGCLIQDSSNDAEIIIEGRIGTLGSDDHQVTFGLPENNAVSNAASLIPNAPTLPSIPEIAFARRESREAASKIAAFAYDRETRRPIWQSGVRHSVATAKNTWVLGVGPFQGGSIREKTKLAGSRFQFGRRSANSSPARPYERPAVDYTAETRFNQGWPDFSGVGHGPDMLASSEDQQEGQDSQSADESKASQAETEVAEAPAEDASKTR
ncbi:hypothetical protein FYK55_23850 [Roseiconus nitratireducens]|uniref:Uncharacterized protein n=1 Tax=Roseiconus nitratireducens TaxID=2605748 RepID=A0A5M6CWL5_9BACT|nr:DUF6655 family protein [Roseiconus nitratireducens]KAA5539604.1 hypothetical protein FYK55_23850 [Roseiconus nitratireducens]